ncbi:MAG: DUF1540 domain-containing protein [Limnochordia bacterium]|jgi:hypothetical protein
MDVHCTIKNCQWWDDNYCAAQSILITSDEIGAQLSEEYDYQQMDNILQQFGESEAPSCMATCCKTFTPRQN